MLYLSLMNKMKETPKRLAPTAETLRALFAKSGNQCAFSDCKHPLIDEDNNFVAQVCHIEDALPGGRFNENMTNEERRGYNNLILFCYRHHVKTNDTEKYLVSKLLEIKLQHEAKSKEPYEVKEVTLINIFNDLKSIKDDTTEILKTVKGHEEQFEAIKTLIKGQEASGEKSDYTEEMESILKLRDSKSHSSALKLLENFKEKKWDKLRDIEKYKLLANMGICHLELNDQKKAAEYFIESANYNTEDEKALGFLALGNAILGKRDEAQSNIEKAIAKNPENLNAYIALITVNRGHLELSEILKKIPMKLYDNSEISYTLGISARYKNDFKGAITWLQNAVDTAERNKADLKATLASTILESVNNPFQIITGQIDNESRNKVNYCIQLFSEAWEELKDSDLRKTRAWVLANRGIAKKFLKDYDGAYEDVKQAVAISGNTHSLLMHMAILAFENKKIDDALELLEQLKSIEAAHDQGGIDVDLLKAELLFAKKLYHQSLEILKEVLKNATNTKIIEDAQSTLIFVYVALKDFAQAKKLSLSIIEERPGFVRGYINASKVNAHLGEKDEALNLLDRAYEQITDESNKTDIQELAYQFYGYKDYPKAIELLERITNPEIYTSLSRTLLEAYFKAGESGKALELCQLIRANYGPIDMVTEMQSAIYESIDDLPKAIEACEEYLKVYPDDQRIQIRLAILYGREKDDNKVKKILRGLTVLGDLPVDILYELAYLNLRINETDEGLRIAFETRRTYKHIKEAHSYYIRFLFEFKALAKQIGEVQYVGVDTAVKLKDESGKVLTYYILENEEKPFTEELLITDPLAKVLLGKGVGDVVSIDRNFDQPQTFEIIDILSKYAYAFQESMELLNNKFVDAEGFRTFRVRGTGNLREDFKPIFDLLDKSEELNTQIREYYHKKLLTIGMFARLRGRNPIKIWSQVLGDIDLGIYSICGGLPNEFQVAHIILEKGTGLVIDLISLLTLASIQELKLLEILPNKKVIARSSIECIDELMREFKGPVSEGYIIMDKFRGQYVQEQITKAQIENNIKHYKNLLHWIEEHCDVLPCNEALSMNASQKERLDKTWGRPFIDSILIAKEHDYLLLADEEVLRATALNEFQVKGFPNYALLEYCLKTRRISKEIFNTEVIKLIGLNYKFIPIDSEILLKCADIAKYQVGYPFDLALKMLGGDISSEDPSIRVATDFFYKLYSTNTIRQVHLNLVITVLNTLVNGRNFIDVLQKLMMLIEIKFKLLPIQKDELKSIIHDFVKSYMPPGQF